MAVRIAIIVWMIYFHVSFVNFISYAILMMIQHFLILLTANEGIIGLHNHLDGMVGGFTFFLS